MGCRLTLFVFLSVAQAYLSAASVVPVTELNLQDGIDSEAVVPEETAPHLHAGTRFDTGKDPLVPQAPPLLQALAEPAVHALSGDILDLARDREAEEATATGGDAASTQEGAEPASAENAQGGAGGEAGEAEEKWDCGSQDSACFDQLGAYVIIISFLVLMTIGFEIVRETIDEYIRGKPEQPIIEGVYSELTVLGFLAVLCFLGHKIGTSHLSLEIYGDKPKEENKERFGEDLEDVHMIIFMVMVCFLFEALGILCLMKYYRKTFNRWENETLMDEQKLEVYGAYLALAQDPPSRFNICAHWNYSDLKGQVMFSLIRQEFVTPRRVDAGHSSRNRNFDFGLYLQKVLSMHLKHIIEVHPSTWVIMIVLIFAFVGLVVLAQGSKHFITAAWIIFGWLLVLIVGIFYFRLSAMYDQFVPVKMGANFLAHSVLADEADLRPEAAATPLLSRPPFLDDFVTDKEIVAANSKESNKTYHKSVHAAQTRVILGSNCYSRCLGEQGKKQVVDRHIEMFRIVLLFCAMLFAIYVQGIADYVFDEHHVAIAVLLTIMALSPPFVVFFCFLGYSMVMLTMVTSIEGMKDLKVVAAVELAQKEKRAIRLLQLITSMRKLAGKDFDSAVLKQLYEKKQKLHRLGGESVKEVENTAQLIVKRSGKEDVANELAIEDMEALFASLDTSGDGLLSQDELTAFLNSFFVAETEQLDTSTLFQLMNVNSETKDSDKVDKAEFIVWVMAAQEWSRSLEPHKFVEVLFAYCDQNSNGSIDVAEFCELFSEKVLKLTGDSFTSTEMAALILEVDTDGDCEIEPHEFLEWIEKYY